MYWVIFQHCHRVAGSIHHSCFQSFFNKMHFYLLCVFNLLILTLLFFQLSVEPIDGSHEFLESVAQTLHQALFAFYICNLNLCRAVTTIKPDLTVRNKTSHQLNGSIITTITVVWMCVSVASLLFSTAIRQRDERSRAKKEHLGMIQVYKTILICCSPSCTVSAWPVPEQFVPQV